MKSNIQNTNNEKELDSREQRISNLIEPLNSQLQVLNKNVNEIEKNKELSLMDDFLSKLIF